MAPKHLAPDAERSLRWWASLPRERLVLGVAATLLAVPLMVLDNLPSGARSAEAVEVVATTSSSTATTARPTTTVRPTTTSTTLPTTTATTAPPATAPPTTAATTTTARPRPTTTTAPTTTAPPTTAPPTTAPPPPPPPPPPGSVEAIIRARFGEAGDAAVRVARCESGLNPNAQSPAGYYGLFQIGRSHATRFQQVTGQSFDAAWMDPDANSQYARYLYDQSGWSVWGCRP